MITLESKVSLHRKNSDLPEDFPKQKLKTLFQVDLNLGSPKDDSFRKMWDSYNKNKEADRKMICSHKDNHWQLLPLLLSISDYLNLLPIEGAYEGSMNMKEVCESKWQF